MASELLLQVERALDRFVPSSDVAGDAVAGTTAPLRPAMDLSAVPPGPPIPPSLPPSSLRGRPLCSPARYGPDAVACVQRCISRVTPPLVVAPRTFARTHAGLLAEDEQQGCCDQRGDLGAVASMVASEQGREVLLYRVALCAIKGKVRSSEAQPVWAAPHSYVEHWRLTLIDCPRSLCAREYPMP